MTRVGGITRDEATKRVMRSLSLRGNDGSLFTRADGTRPIVVALPDEHISEVIPRVEAIGGTANVAIAYAKSFQVMTLGDNLGTTTGELVISQDLSMGMLSIRLSHNPGKIVRLRFRDVDADIPVGTIELAYA